MAENELVLALDAGTQSIRALLIDFEGTIHGQVKTAVEPYFATQPGWAELDPEYYYRKLCETSKALFAKAGARAKDVVAVTLATQRMTFVNVDREGRPLRPAIVWLDQRKADTRKILPGAIRPALRAAKLHDFADFAVGYCRSNWIRQEQPDVWEATHKYVVLSGVHGQPSELLKKSHIVADPARAKLRATLEEAIQDALEHIRAGKSSAASHQHAKKQ